MFTWTDQQIGGWVAMHLWPLFRIASFLMILPMIGTQLVSMRVRLGFAILFTVAVVPALPPVPALDPFSIQTVRITLEQIAIGLFMGFAVYMLFQLMIISGQIIAMQMGLGFAQMVDPTNGISVTGLSQFYLMIVSLVFLAMNGHLVAFEALAESFQVMPIGGPAISTDMWWLLATRISWMFASALVIALPAVTTLLVVNISLGVMTRAAPQMNIFSIGFPLTVVFGLVVFWVSTAGLIPQFEGFSEATFAFLRDAMQHSSMAP